jgi:acyl carrier protein
MSAELVTPTEQELARIWVEILELDSVSRDQDFFDIGGDSLTATKVVLLARRAWNVRFTVRVLLDSPVLKDLAERIDILTADAASTPEGLPGSA